MIIIPLFFILAVLVNNYVSAFFVGTSFAPFFISFLMALLLYIENYRWRFFSGFVCAVMFEIISMFHFGTFAFPFLAVALIYTWISAFIELRDSGQGGYIRMLAGDGLLIGVLTYFFITVYAVFVTGYQLDEVGSFLAKIMDLKAIVYTIGGSLVWTILFKKFKFRPHVQHF